MRINCIALGHNILMPGFDPSTSVARNRHSNHMTNMRDITFNASLICTYTTYFKIGVSAYLTRVLFPLFIGCILVRRFDTRLLIVIVDYIDICGWISTMDIIVFKTHVFVHDVTLNVCTSPTMYQIYAVGQMVFSPYTLLLLRDILACLIKC